MFEKKSIFSIRKLGKYVGSVAIATGLFFVLGSDAHAEQYNNPQFKDVNTSLDGANEKTTGELIDSKKDRSNDSLKILEETYSKDDTPGKTPATNLPLSNQAHDKLNESIKNIDNYDYTGTSINYNLKRAKSDVTIVYIDENGNTITHIIKDVPVGDDFTIPSSFEENGKTYVIPTSEAGKKIPVNRGTNTITIDTDTRPKTTDPLTKEEDKTKETEGTKPPENKNENNTKVETGKDAESKKDEEKDIIKSVPRDDEFNKPTTPTTETAIEDGNKIPDKTGEQTEAKVAKQEEKAEVKVVMVAIPMETKYIGAIYRDKETKKELARTALENLKEVDDSNRYVYVPEALTFEWYDPYSQWRPLEFEYNKDTKTVWYYFDYNRKKTQVIAKFVDENNNTLSPAVSVVQRAGEAYTLPEAANIEPKKQRIELTEKVIYQTTSFHVKESPTVPKDAILPLEGVTVTYVYSTKIDTKEVPKHTIKTTYVDVEDEKQVLKRYPFPTQVVEEGRPFAYARDLHLDNDNNNYYDYIGTEIILEDGTKKVLLAKDNDVAKKAIENLKDPVDLAIAASEKDTPHTLTVYENSRGELLTPQSNATVRHLYKRKRVKIIATYYDKQGNKLEDDEVQENQKAGLPYKTTLKPIQTKFNNKNETDNHVFYNFFTYNATAPYGASGDKLLAVNIENGELVYRVNYIYDTYTTPISVDKTNINTIYKEKDENMEIDPTSNIKQEAGRLLIIPERNDNNLTSNDGYFDYKYTEITTNSNTIYLTKDSLNTSNTLPIIIDAQGTRPILLNLKELKDKGLLDGIDKITIQDGQPTPANILVSDKESMNITHYYERAKADLLVKYLESNTNRTLHDGVTIEKLPAGKNHTEVAKEIEKETEERDFVKKVDYLDTFYIPIEKSKDILIKRKDNELIFYYDKTPRTTIKQKFPATIDFVDEDGNKLSNTEEKVLIELEDHLKAVADLNPNYDIDLNSISVVHHYKKAATTLTVKYLEKGTSIEVKSEKTTPVRINSTYAENGDEFIDKDGIRYKLVGLRDTSAKASDIVNDVSKPIEVIFDYQKVGKVKIVHKLGNIILKEEVKEDLPYGENYTSNSSTFNDKVELKKEDDLTIRTTTSTILKTTPVNANGTIDRPEILVEYIYELKSNSVALPNDIATPELTTTLFVVEDTNDILEAEEGLVAKKDTIGNYHYTGKTTEENGIRTHFYKLVEPLQEERATAKLTRFVDENNVAIDNDINDFVDAPKIIKGKYHYTGKTTEENGIRTHFYKLIEPVLEERATAKLTRFVDENNVAIDNDVNDFVDAPKIIKGKYHYSGKTTEENGVRTHFYKLIEPRKDESPKDETPQFPPRKELSIHPQTPQQPNELADNVQGNIPDENILKVHKRELPKTTTSTSNTSAFGLLALLSLLGLKRKNKEN